jgi:hypothetical protein
VQQPLGASLTTLDQSVNLVDEQDVAVRHLAEQHADFRSAHLPADYMHGSGHREGGKEREARLADPRGG